MLKTLTRLLAAASLITGVLAVPQALAQAYPSKPITIVVPFAAGSGTDQ
jgi:tripartite-type tricarboxylate transporter receptor subunit TctC